MEDKKKICEMPLPVLQETRGFKDLISLKYEQEGSDEIVVATYYDGYQKVANVTADSETAMIIDIIKQCMLRGVRHGRIMQKLWAGAFCISRNTGRG